MLLTAMPHARTTYQGFGRCSTKTGIDILRISTDCPPLKIKANGIKGGTTSVNGSVSSKHITALLLAAPLAKDDVTINIDGDLTSKPMWI